MGCYNGCVLDKLKQKMNKFWTPQRVIMAVVVVAVLVWVVPTIQVLNNNYNLQRQVDNAVLDNQVTELENENLRLEQMYYQTDEYMDLSARSLLGKAAPGEHLVILPRVEHGDVATDDGSATVEQSNLDQWLDFLFGQHN